MLKFPVGSGRARFVAQQLKRRKLREQRMKTEEKRKLLEDKKSQMKAETQIMPNLNQEKLPSDEECCIILEEIVVSETEEDGTDELIERVSKRQLKRSSSLDLSRSSAKELLADKQDQQQLPLFRWHNPDCSDNSRKMGILEDISLSASVDIQVGFSEMPNTSSETASQQQPQQHQQVIVEVVAAELQPQKQPSPRPCAEVVEQSQQVVEVQHLEVQRQQDQQRLQQQHQQQQHPQQQYQPHIAAAAKRLPAATTANSRDMEPLRQQLMHRIILPQLQTEDLPESSIVNNNAVSLMNQNLQPHFIDSSMGDSEWTQLQYDKYALVLSSQHQQQNQQQQHQKQQQHQQQNQQHQQQQQRQQQLVPLWQQQQPSYQMSHQEHQHLEAGREELQQLNAQYQRLKCQEEEKLKCLNNTLKEVYADRLLSERQHADLHRLFMHKMVESKKHEDSLHAQRDQLKRQLKEDLDSLEQRIAEKQRQLQERSRSWQWQQHPQQQYHHHHQHPNQQQHQQQRQLQYQQQQQLQLTYSQQQHQHQQQQQHQYYLRQLQPPPYQPRLQCFQDAFSQYAESQLVDSNNTLMPPPPPPLPPPPVTTTTLASLRPTPMQPPPPVAYRTDIRQQPPRSGRMMRRRHTIDHRANNMMLYPPYATPAAPPRDALHRTNVTAATTAHFSRPDTSTTVANERNHVNQAIEQTAITSIISNYVTNYLNDMESRNP
ncbi:transcription factor SPT20 homolog [Drosophila nasuta]|uniref:transcription factor SPT20 homolog n=1 Tax=Drosophila nasuta TaxID=42062 RepID=UPI00295F1141|nr:transcription factor SPT20 homolog [Drosophila nasuta]